jgi:hypothetical protein
MSMKQKPIKQDPQAWTAGYLAGLEGKAQPTPPGVDGLAFQSGIIEGKADRLKKPEERRGGKKLAR